MITDRLQDPGIAEQVRDSFVQEARSLAGLRHRSLPTIVDVFSIEARQYLVSSKVPGRLSETLVRKGDTVAKGDRVAFVGARRACRCARSASSAQCCRPRSAACLSGSVQPKVPQRS